MKLLKKLFNKNEEPINTYEDFWLWFSKNEKSFFKVVKQHSNIEKDFFNKIEPKLAELKDGYYFVTGMHDDDTAELILTADGYIENFVFVEELVDAAPKLDRWIFTALKPPLNIEDVNVAMKGFSFNGDKMSFYPLESTDYPDEIEITIVHDDYGASTKDIISKGVFIFLDNCLGELEFATAIDSFEVKGKGKTTENLIPLSKLKSYLTWRQKEFVEKYEDSTYNAEGDDYSILEARLKSGLPMVAVINRNVLTWESKASHPWILKVESKYNSKGGQGMPNDEELAVLNELEDDMVNKLKDYEGYLHIGRQTGNNARQTFFACKDFRYPSKVLYKLQKKFAQQLEIDYEIYKDKYWQTFEMYNVV